MLVPINQAVRYIRDKYDVPKEWTSVINIKPNHNKEKKTDSRVYLNWLGKKDVVQTSLNGKTVLYETDDLDAVFSNWNKTVTVSYADVEKNLLSEAKKYIKQQLLNRMDIGVIKYNLTSDGLFKVYKNTEVKVMDKNRKIIA